MTSHRARGVSRAGMTILEVAVSMMVLMLVFFGAYALIVRSAAVMRATRNHYVAATIAQNRLERSANLDYNTLYLVAEDRVVVDENGAPATYGGFRRTTTVDTNYWQTIKGIDVTNTLVQVIVEIKGVMQTDFIHVSGFLTTNNAGNFESARSIFTQYLEY